MNLKNYTSSVPVNLTVARIEQLLADAGALGVNKDYASGQLLKAGGFKQLPAPKE